MIGTRFTCGVWRISVTGAVTPVTASLLEGFRVTVAETKASTLLQIGPLRSDACADVIAGLQSLGLDVVELHWKDLRPGAT